MLADDDRCPHSVVAMVDRHQTAVSALVGLALTVVSACASLAETEMAEYPEARASIDEPLYSIPDEPAGLEERGPEPSERPQPSQPEGEGILVRDVPGPGQSPGPQSRPEPTEQQLSDACARGKASAREDAEAGRMVVSVYGYPARCAPTYWRMLGEHYQVHIVHHGCVVPEMDPLHVRFRRCYSDEVDVIVKERHGEDAYERLRIEAETVCEQERAARG